MEDLKAQIENLTNETKDLRGQLQTKEDKLKELKAQLAEEERAANAPKVDETRFYTFDHRNYRAEYVIKITKIDDPEGNFIGEGEILAVLSVSPEEWTKSAYGVGDTVGIDSAYLGEIATETHVPEEVVTTPAHKAWK